MHSKQNEKKDGIFNRVKKALPSTVASLLTGQASPQYSRFAPYLPEICQAGGASRHNRIHPVRYIKTKEKLLYETYS